MKNPIICALDTKEINIAKELCFQIKPHIGLVKLGLEFKTNKAMSGVVWKVKYMVDTAMKRQIIELISQDEDQ